MPVYESSVQPWNGRSTTLPQKMSVAGRPSGASVADMDVAGSVALAGRVQRVIVTCLPVATDVIGPPWKPHVAAAFAIA